MICNAAEMIIGGAKANKVYFLLSRQMILIIYWFAYRLLGACINVREKIAENKSISAR